MPEVHRSSPDPLSDTSPYSQDGEAMDALLRDVELPFTNSTPTAVQGRRFTMAAEDLSAPSLAQGFQYQAKPPNPPGQFAGRSNQPVAPVKEDAILPKVSGRSATVQRRQRLQEPLLLPEVSFLPPNQDTSQRSPHFREPVPTRGSSPVKTLGQEGVVLTQGVPKRPPDQVGIIAISNNGAEAQEDASNRASGAVHSVENVSASHPDNRGKARDSNSAVRSTPPGMSPKMQPVEKSSPRVPLQQTWGDLNISSVAVASNEALNVGTHILRKLEPCRSSSPISACGDLEKPARRPRASRASKSPRCAISRPLPCSESPRLCRPEDLRRSQSRASNVSKKRSTSHKHSGFARGQRSTDRKKMMQEMAAQWNEYLLAADRDKEECRLEIEALQHGMDLQAVELENAKRQVQRKEQQLSEMRSECNQLQEKHEKTLAGREQLDEEVQDLRRELHLTKEQSDGVRERNSACRKKLNEAISEQQKLFKLSRSYCSDLQKNLDAEQKERAEQAFEVREALHKTNLQRKAMKEFLSFVREEVAARETLKDETISALRSQVCEQYQTLSRVAFLEKSLSTQLHAQQATQRSIDELHGTLSAFARVYDRDSDARAVLAAAIDVTADRLQTVADRVDTVDADAVTKDEAAGYFKSLEKRLASSLESILRHMAEKEESDQQRMNAMEEALRSGFASLGDELTEQAFRAGTSSAASSEAFHKDVSARLDHFATWLQSNQESTERIDRQLSSMISEGEGRALVASSRLDESAKELEKRDCKISELRTQLQLVTEDYNARLGAVMRDVDIHEASRQLRDKHLEHQMDEIGKAFEAQLDFALAQQREEAELAMREEEAGHLTAQNSLREAKAKLQALTVQADEMSGLEQRLEEQKDLARGLREQISAHERQAAAHKDLGARWRQDIEAVDKIRPLLKSVSAQIPHIEEIGGAFDKIMRIHEFLSSTAGYLTTEQEWVRRQLRSVAKPGSSSSKLLEVTDATGERQCAQGEPDESITASQDLGTPQQEWERRRVVVQSPSGSLGSPSPPPSVQQERKRRRAGFETQSILRLSGTAPNVPVSQRSRDSVAEEIAEPTRGLFDLMKGHSRYFRPMTSTAPVPATLSVPDSGVVEQIRASLTQAGGLPWSLPTLADFERPRQGQTGADEDAEYASAGKRGSESSSSCENVSARSAANRGAAGHGRGSTIRGARSVNRARTHL